MLHIPRKRLSNKQKQQLAASLDWLERKLDYDLREVREQLAQKEQELKVVNFAQSLESFE